MDEEREVQQPLGEINDERISLQPDFKGLALDRHIGDNRKGAKRKKQTELFLDCSGIFGSARSEFFALVRPRMESKC